MENETSDDDPQLGILVHQLPQECMWKALTFLPKDSKSKILEDETGMKVFFSSANRATECIRKKNIEIDGISYNIYPLVTCLTVYDIHNSISKEMIKNCLKDINFPVICVDRVGSSYRVILNVPEVFANFRPPSISLPNLSLKLPIQFYCRACHKEGHRQYQCSRKNSLHHGSSRNLKSTARSDKGSRVTKSQRKDSGVTLKIQQITHSVQVESEPSTSSTQTAAEGMVEQRTVPTNRNKDSQKMPQESRGRKEKFPCKEIQDIIPNISGILPTKKFLLFLQTVYGKKDPFSCAENFTPHVKALIDQIEDLIDYYHNHDSISKGALSNRDIRTLDSLCDRLDRQLSSDSD